MNFMVRELRLCMDGSAVDFCAAAGNSNAGGVLSIIFALWKYATYEAATINRGPNFWGGPD
jgi:hypothetical protein